MPDESTEDAIMRVVRRTDAKYGRGTTPLLLKDFHNSLCYGEGKLRGALHRLVERGDLRVGKWGRANAWSSPEELHDD